MNTKIVIATTLLRRWGIKASKVKQLLAEDDLQLDERINTIIDIHNLVYKKQDNSKAIKAFMADPNHKIGWNGHRPQAIIESGSIDDLRYVLKRLLAKKLKIKSIRLALKPTIILSLLLPAPPRIKKKK